MQSENSIQKEDLKDSLFKKNKTQLPENFKMVICGAKILYLEDQELVNLNSFIEIQSGKSKCRTSIAHHGGLNPRWNSIFQLTYQNAEDEIFLRLYIDNYNYNELIGERAIKLKDIIFQN